MAAGRLATPLIRGRHQRRTPSASGRSSFSIQNPAPANSGRSRRLGWQPPRRIPTGARAGPASAPDAVSCFGRARGRAASSSTRTRRASAAARSGSGTVQKTRVATTVSKLPSSKGSSSAETSTTEGRAAAVPSSREPLAKPRGHVGVRLRHHQLCDRVRVVPEIDTGAGSQLQVRPDADPSSSCRISARPALSVLSRIQS